jgi:biotin carboxyl carrier protein
MSMEGKKQPENAAVPPAAAVAAPAPEPDADFRVDDTVYRTGLTRKYRERKPYRPRDPRLITAAIPGLIVEVQVQSGDVIQRHQPVVVLEAMKMRNNILATDPGTVATVHVSEGQVVAKGDLLVELK